MHSGRAVVLTYHSHHVVGPSYAENDHLALAMDLELITEVGGLLVPLADIVDSLVGDRDSRSPRHGAWLRVAITFDDGPNYDVMPLDHPVLGRQPGFLGVMRQFIAKHGERCQSGLSATSFVIASPEARRVIETTFDPQYTFQEPGSMTDDWWDGAIDTGLISIANHSWDHLHPALSELAHSQQARADFARVRTPEDADRQIAAAGRFIAARTHGRASPFFAYPFGHYNEFLTKHYFPGVRTHGVRAAFTVDPRRVAPAQNVWRIPRFVCGDDWKSPGELEAILLA